MASDFNKITTPKKRYKTRLKCEMHTRSRNQKRENIQFQSAIVAISGFQDSSPNGSAGGWLTPPMAADTCA